MARGNLGDTAEGPQGVARVANPELQKCLELKTSVNGTSREELSDLVEKVNHACRAALAESHLNAAQFWTKYR